MGGLKVEFCNVGAIINVGIVCEFKKHEPVRFPPLGGRREGFNEFEKQM
jgi:hypothetical protein